MQCLHMEAGKTASLLAASASLGAAAYGASPERVRLLAEYGHHLGMAFQLVDDMLGIWGETGTTGKPVAADLAARKRSAPVVAALSSGSEAGERLRAVLAAPATSAPPISSSRPIWWSRPAAADGPENAPTCTLARP